MIFDTKAGDIPKASAAFTDALCKIWQGQPEMTISGFFSSALDFMEL